MKVLFLGMSGLLVALNWYLDPWYGWFMFAGLTVAYGFGRRSQEKQS